MLKDMQELKLYVIAGKSLNMCKKCRSNNPDVDELAYSINFHKALIWVRLKKYKHLMISVTERNKNIADIIVRDLTADGIIYDTELKGPLDVMIGKDDNEKLIRVYQYKLNIVASLT